MAASQGYDDVHARADVSGGPNRRRIAVGAVVVGALALIFGMPTGHAGAATAAKAPVVCAANRNIMSPPTVSASDLARWFASKNITGVTAQVSVAELAKLFIQEGNAEGVAGDIAFVQTMIETGWLRFPSNGQVRPEYHNYAGIGAVDGGNTPNVFLNARIGVRAQIQHLRAYAEPGVTPAKLRYPLVDPRFDAARWSTGFYGPVPTVLQLSGRWASDKTYGTKIMALHNELVTFSGGDCSRVK